MLWAAIWCRGLEVSISEVQYPVLRRRRARLQGVQVAVRRRVLGMCKCCHVRVNML